MDTKKERDKAMKTAYAFAKAGNQTWAQVWIDRACQRLDDDLPGAGRTGIGHIDEFGDFDRRPKARELDSLHRQRSSLRRWQRRLLVAATDFAKSNRLINDVG